MALIRLAQEADAEAVAAIYAPFVENTVVSFEVKPPEAREMRRLVLQTLSSHPWLVCVLENNVVGYAYATQHRTRAAYRWSVDTSVYIDPRHHRRGVGRGLYESLFAVLGAQGFVNAYAGITLPNEASVGLHEAVGFQKIGVYEHVGYKQDAWHDVGWWYRTIAGLSGTPSEPLPLPALVATPGWEQLLSKGVAAIGSRTAETPLRRT